MFEVGNVDDKGKRLIEASEICLQKAIEICKPNESFCNIGNINTFSYLSIFLA
jgi:methionine aminopeptidase